MAESLVSPLTDQTKILLSQSTCFPSRRQRSSIRPGRVERVSHPEEGKELETIQLSKLQVEKNLLKDSLPSYLKLLSLLLIHFFNN